MRKRCLGTVLILCLIALICTPIAFASESASTDFSGYTAIGTPDELLL